MKKVSLVVLVALLVCTAVVLIRTATLFPDRQLPPAELGASAAIDEAGAIKRFAGAIRIPTVSHDDRSNFDAAAFERFHTYLAEQFPAVHAATERSVIGGHSLLFKLAGSRSDLEPVLFAGHMDVVPVDDATLENWTHPPFDGIVADGNVWGRGTMDDKLTVIALLEAMESLLGSGFAPERTLYLAFGHDEEVGGHDGAQAIAAHLAEQGVRLAFMIDEGGVVTEGMYPGIDRPVAIIGVAEKGYVNTRLIVEEAGGHSSQPPPQTGLGILARAIVAVEEAPFPSTLDHVAMTFSHLGHAAPFTMRLYFGNRWLFGPLMKRKLLGSRTAAASMHTTIAPTMASGSSKSNILPTRAQAVVNYRIIPGETTETVRQHVFEAIDDDRVTVRVEMGTDPSPVSPTDSWGYELIASAIRGVDPDILVAPYLVQGGTDAKYYYAVTPNAYRFMMVSASPETLRLVHGIDEHVAVDAYLQAVRFYRHLLDQSGQPAR